MRESGKRESPDPALLRGALGARRPSRRDLLRSLAAGAGGLGAAALLEACGVNPPAGKPGGGSSRGGAGSPAWWSRQKLHHSLNFANWPYYIDVSHGHYPSLERFTSQTGIKVSYAEVIADDDAFYAKIRPELQAGQPTGYDIIALANSDPPLGFMMELGWLIPLDQARMPNFGRYASPLVKNPPWDPGNRYTMAWQSGWTAIAYNTDAIKRPIGSVLDLWDPAFAGKVGMMSLPSELGSFGLLAIGVDPARSGPGDWQKAAAKLKAQKDAGIVRQYYDQSYIHALTSGDTWISMCWSGDIFQANLNGHRNLRAVMPREGGMFWTTALCIPQHAQNPLDAMTYMDFIYQPDVEGMIENYVNYVCPVPAARKVIASRFHDQVVAASPWVFPTTDFQSLSRNYYQWRNPGELSQWNALFEPITL